MKVLKDMEKACVGTLEEEEEKEEKKEEEEEDRLRHQGGNDTKRKP